VLREASTDALSRPTRGLALSVDRRPCVQRLELSKLLDQRPFEIHTATLPEPDRGEEPASRHADRRRLEPDPPVAARSKAELTPLMDGLQYIGSLSTSRVDQVLDGLRFQQASFFGDR
jgi:hypothetical protein